MTKNYFSEINNQNRLELTRIFDKQKVDTREIYLEFEFSLRKLVNGNERSN